MELRAVDAGADNQAPRRPSTFPRREIRAPSARLPYPLGWLGSASRNLADLNPGSVQKIEADDITILVTTLVRLRDALGCEWKRLRGA